jgi:hypothetical protein
MQKNFILTVLLATALFVGGYLAWTTWVSPRPATSVESASIQPNDEPQLKTPAITPNPTIVTASVNKDGIPEKLGALSLTNSVLGKDALNEFAQLHGEGFDLLGGYRADYAGAGSKATLWVGQAKDAAAAEKLVKQMADKIGAGNPMFTNLKELSISSRTMYQVEGQGQSHFFYASNDKIVWLAADPAYAPDALHSLWGAVK